MMNDGLHEGFTSGIVPAIFAIGFLFLAGFLPSILRKQHIQRSWVLTCTPFSILIFMILTDGEFLSGAKEITMAIIIVCGLYGGCWQVINFLEKNPNRGIKVKKGDIEVEVGDAPPSS